jgi:hypothetical protein
MSLDPTAGQSPPLGVNNDHVPGSPPERTHWLVILLALQALFKTPMDSPSTWTTAEKGQECSITAIL